MAVSVDPSFAGFGLLDPGVNKAAMPTLVLSPYALSRTKRVMQDFNYIPAPPIRTQSTQKAMIPMMPPSIVKVPACPVTRSTSAPMNMGTTMKTTASSNTAKQPEPQRSFSMSRSALSTPHTTRTATPRAKITASPLITVFTKASKSGGHLMHRVLPAGRAIGSELGSRVPGDAIASIRRVPRSSTATNGLSLSGGFFARRPSHHKTQRSTTSSTRVL